MDNEKKDLPNEPQGKMALLRAQYPPIKVREYNPRYAQILSESLAGATSELTAITLYLYQHHDAEERFPEFSSALEDIAIVEMHHLDLLAQLIKLLGGDPRYCGSCGTQWSARNVNYLTGDPYKQLVADIEAERAAITQYRQQVIQICDPYIQKILERIIQDEQDHLRTFERLLGRFCQPPR